MDPIVKITRLVLNTDEIVPDWGKVHKRLSELLDENLNKLKLLNYFSYLSTNPNTNYKVSLVQFKNIRSYLILIVDILHSAKDYLTSASLIYLTQYFCYEEAIQSKDADPISTNPFDQSIFPDIEEGMNLANSHLAGDSLQNYSEVAGLREEQDGLAQIKESDIMNQSLALSQLSKTPEKLTPEEKAKKCSSGHSKIVFLYLSFLETNLAKDGVFWKMALKDLLEVNPRTIIKV